MHKFLTVGQRCAVGCFRARSPCENRRGIIWRDEHQDNLRAASRVEVQTIPPTNSDRWKASEYELPYSPRLSPESVAEIQAIPPFDSWFMGSFQI